MLWRSEHEGETALQGSLYALMQSMIGSLRDLLPIILVIAFFQLVVLQQPLPDLVGVITGVLFVVLGLTFFIYGLEMGLFPIGESMAHAFARKGSVSWLVLFSFALGFGTTVAEPALIAVAADVRHWDDYCNNEGNHTFLWRLLVPVFSGAGVAGLD